MLLEATQRSHSRESLSSKGGRFFPFFKYLVLCTLRVDSSGMQQVVYCSLHEVHNNFSHSFIPGLTGGIHVAPTSARAGQQHRPLPVMYTPVVYSLNSNLVAQFGYRISIGVRLVLEALFLSVWFNFGS